MFEPVVKQNRVNTHKAAAVYETLSCEVCDGEMISSGKAISNAFSTSWEHFCNRCHVEEWIEGGYYPRTDIQKVEETLQRLADLGQEMDKEI